MKSIKNRLFDSVEEFQSLADSMPQIVWATDAEGANIFFNQRWVEYTGLSFEESCGHEWVKPFHPDDQKMAWDAWQNAVQNKVEYSLECRLRRADGIYQWWLIRGVPHIGSDGKIDRWYGTCTDIHELKDTYDLIVMAEHYAGVGSWRWDLSTNEVIWSEELTLIFGFRPQNLRSHINVWRQTVHPDDREGVKRAVKEAIEGEKLYSTSYRIVLPTGEVRWIEARGQVEYDPNGKPKYFNGICLNVTAREQAQDRFHESERRFHDMFAYLTVGYNSFDADGIWVDANQKMATMLGFATAEEMIGQSFIEYWPEASKTLVQSVVADFFKSHRIEREVDLILRDGTPVTFYVSGRTQHDVTGRLLRTHSIVIDISDRKKVENEIRELNANLEARVNERTVELLKVNEDLQVISRHDVLTGLSNRLAANERLRTEFVAMKRSLNSYGVMMLDIDHFKVVNDAYGHEVGDRVLKQVADILSSSVRESDFAARFGGEEFLVLLPNSKIWQAKLVAEKIRLAIESASYPVVENITLSIGLSMAIPEHSDEDVAVKEADDALYVAKEGGRNRVVAAEIPTV